jgi:hypothetical protein
MVKTAEIANASNPQTIVIQGSMIQDLPIDVNDPANPHPVPVEPGAQPGSLAEDRLQPLEKKRA